VNGTRHREVGEYLRRLQRSMGDLPAERREEILAEIEEHIAELLAENPAETDADMRNVLERVGHPEDIAAEARERFEIIPVTDDARIWVLTCGFDASAVPVISSRSRSFAGRMRDETDVLRWHLSASAPGSILGGGGGGKTVRRRTRQASGWCASRLGDGGRVA
jgi:hypothetical protein